MKVEWRPLKGRWVSHLWRDHQFIEAGPLKVSACGFIYPPHKIDAQDISERRCKNCLRAISK